MSYDIIGDIHGHFDELCQLLSKLGYRQSSGHFAHPERKALFLGDFIDRGPQQREVVDAVRAMVEEGAALAVMGNHEFNAICFATLHPVTGEHLRPHIEKNVGQHQAFLSAYATDPKGRQEALEWFKTLPMSMEIDGLRLVHACWDRHALELIEGYKTDTGAFELDFWVEASLHGSRLYEAVETVLKGKELPLPPGRSFLDKEENPRTEIRVRWWDKHATSYRDAYLGPPSARSKIPDQDTHGDHLVEYGADEPPVFLGHYWLDGELEPLANNIACLDYSVAKPGGELVAYRWDGESTLTSDRFVSVPRSEK